MIEPRKGGAATYQPRRDSLYQAHVADPYQARGKYSEPTVCPDCNAVFHNGRWQWADVPRDASPHRCPACSRINDGLPAGVLVLEGGFFSEHRDEIMNLVRHTEENEKAMHPLERIMKLEETGDDRVVINYTGSHLARRTGTAIQNAYKGELAIDQSDKDDVLRASWVR